MTGEFGVSISCFPASAACFRNLLGVPQSSRRSAIFSAFRNLLGVDGTDSVAVAHFSLLRCVPAQENARVGDIAAAWAQTDPADGGWIGKNPATALQELGIENQLQFIPAVCHDILHFSTRVLANSWEKRAVDATA